MLERSTYYILDAQGNTLSTYEHEVSNGGVYYTLKERQIYGSSRLGIYNDSVSMYNSAPNNGNISVEHGHRYYELSNHLGNVLTIINDVKIPTSSNATTVNGYLVGIVNTSDYSPFGVQLDGRTVSDGRYRYGYQGSESDSEVKGEGNSYTTHFRQLDPRVGRWLSIDPKRTAWESPYVSMGNNPILNNDVLGDKIKVQGGVGFRIATRFRIMRIKMISSAKVKAQIKSIQKDKNKILTITNKFTRNSKELPGGFIPTSHPKYARIVLAKGSILKSIYYPGEKTVKNSDGTEHQEIIVGDPLVVLSNEMSHAIDWYTQRNNDIPVMDEIDGTETSLAEFESNEFENTIRKKQKKPLRFVKSHVGNIAPNKRIARRLAKNSKITDPVKKEAAQSKLNKRIEKKEDE